MREYYEALKQTPYGEMLNSNVRFAGFKPESVTNQQWVDVLGQDVNNMEHMEFTAGITAWYIFTAEELGDPISPEDQELLMKTAWVHDFSEAIDGDVADPLKDHSVSAKEAEIQSFIKVAATVTPEAEKLAREVFPVLHGEHPLSRAFRAIEIIGYCTTGEKAMQQAPRQRGELRVALNSLYQAVWDRDFQKLKSYSDLAPVRAYIESKRNHRQNWIFRQRVIQSIMQEGNYRACSEQAGREDEMWFRLDELVAEGLLSPSEKEDCYYEYRESYA